MANKQTIFTYLNQKIPLFLVRYQGEITNIFHIINQLRAQLTQLKSVKVILNQLFDDLYQPILLKNFDYEQRLQNIKVLIEQVVVGFEQNHLQ